MIPSLATIAPRCRSSLHPCVALRSWQYLLFLSLSMLCLPPHFFVCCHSPSSPLLSLSLSLLHNCPHQASLIPPPSSMLLPFPTPFLPTCYLSPSPVAALSSFHNTPIPFPPLSSLLLSLPLLRHHSYRVSPTTPSPFPPPCFSPLPTISFAPTGESLCWRKELKTNPMPYIN